MNRKEWISTMDDAYCNAKTLTITNDNCREVSALLALRWPWQKDDNLLTVPTCELVEELSKREGVRRIDVGPYTVSTIKTNGPAILFEIID